MVVGLGIAAWSATVYLWRSRPSVGGSDFFYYVCYARDMRQAPAAVPASAYRYFPGVYTFWRGAMALGGTSLARLQDSYALLLAANALLVAAIVGRACRAMWAAVYAGVWYLVACSRFQGLAGVSEPIATLPFLIGLLVWNGEPLSGRRGWFATIGLGVGLGLAIYSRQQAGLWSLGAAWLLVERCLRSRVSGALAVTVQTSSVSRPHSWFQLAALPAIAGLCLLLALFAEGRGLLPLQEGLRQAREYPPAGSLALNLYTQIRADEIAAAALLVATGLLVRLVILNYQRAMPDSHQVRLAGFCVCAAVATLAQFARRPYLHYALLPAPCLIIAVVILAQQGCRQLVPRRLRGEVLRWGLMLLAALPWLYAIRRPDTLAVWRVVLPREFVVQTLWHQQPEISRSLNALRSVVAPGESLAVVPPRLNSVHYLLGSRCEPGQGYGFGITRAQLDWERLPRVLVVKNSLDEADHALWGGEERERLARRLIAAGFVVELDLDSMTLYRRRSTR